MVIWRIKKRWNIYLYYWTIFAFVTFFLLNYYANYYTTNFSQEYTNIGIMISVLSFLFGFLVNISFSMITNRINSLKNELASETGRIVNLYLLSRNLGSKFHENVREMIDEYTINTLRHYTNYEVGRDIFYKMQKETENMEIKTDYQRMCAGSFISNLSDWEQIREKLEYITSGRGEWSLKIATYLLGFILIGLLYLNRGDKFTNGLFIVLSTVIVFIFLIIEDFDSLRIGDYIINISNSEQIFDLIEKERYYPEKLISRVKLDRNRVYRIGIFNKKESQERIFKLTYNPYFEIKLARIAFNFWDKKQ